MSSRSKPLAISEQFIRQLWKNQRFTSSNLKTVDGKPIEILFPGTQNQDGGPDFTGARIRIGSVLYTGDVEIHRRYGEWRAHHHNRDPKYNSVILHVVLRGKPNLPRPLTNSQRPIPVLAIGEYLHPSKRSTWRAIILEERAARLARIKCFGRNNFVDSDVVRSWLNKLASERIELKIRRFEERLRELTDEEYLRLRESPSQYGEIPFGVNPEELPPPAREHSPHRYGGLQTWEQLAYEGIMAALGYDKNQEPFHRLASNLTLRLIAEYFSPASPGDPCTKLEAALFSIAGLLHELPEPGDKESKRHMKMLRNVWMLCRPYYKGEMLNAADWQFLRLRPENFPTIRLAGAARLVPKLVRKSFFKYAVQIIKGDILSVRERYVILESFLTIPSEGFWSAHYRFGEKAKKEVKTLIGASRAAEIILNALLPICLLYARLFKDGALRDGALAMIAECPPAGDYVVTGIIERQLIKKRFNLDSAMLHQGALQLYKFYCVEERCSECAVGKIVFKP
ncbi:MAG: DUF2851 family protein [Ignavibacteria bacterium]|nr:MAG: DUF2851 family protein [Ignavibacteria bacterium]